MFDEELFLQLTREMKIEVVKGHGKDLVKGKPVDSMKIIFKPFSFKEGNKSMIKIKEKNRYKVLKPEEFKAGNKLLGEYELWENNSMVPAHICFLKSFGDKDDLKYGNYNSMWLGFNTRTKALHLYCSSYGGMCGFIFSEKDLERKDLSDIDIECMEFTINLVKELNDNGIIEVKK